METNGKTRINNHVTTLQKLTTSTNVINMENGSYVWVSSGRPVHNYLAVPNYPKQKEQEKNSCAQLHQVASHVKDPHCISVTNTFEEPIDLTCSNRRSYEETRGILVPGRQHINNAVNYENFLEQNRQDVALRKGRKRKHEVNEIRMRNGYLNVPKPDITECFQIADNKKAEVLKAAKSLFSKRTRTLYHWMYPNTPKAQLKFAVATSWETLGIQEKEFYISQVLGRFGFPQANLMVNPQLDSMSSFWHLSNSFDTTASTSAANEETSTAVSSLLMSENASLNNNQMWLQPPIASTSATPSYKKNKQNRLGRPPGSRNRKVSKEDYSSPLRQIRDEPAVVDEFQDDPELSSEFQQFRWALHLSNNVKTEM